MGFILTDPEFYSPRSIGVENANDAGEVACEQSKHNRMAFNDMYVLKHIACTSGL